MLAVIYSAYLLALMSLFPRAFAVQKHDHWAGAMKSLALKIQIVLMQIFPFVSMLELIFLRSLWTMPISIALIGSAAFYKCKNCATPLGDGRVLGRKIPFKLSGIDSCPVCGSNFAERDQH